MPTDDNHQRRPLRSRRLFSFDSARSSSSTQNSSADHVTLPQARRPLNPFDLSDVQEADDEHDHTIHAPRAQRSSTEPTPSITPLTQVDFDTPHPRTRLEPVRPIAIAPVPLRAFSTDTTQVTPSPTRRWENLRQHVLPATSRPGTPPQRPPSAQSSFRAGTPKPSRLAARLGFRHVVEQVREETDDTRRFGEELRRACVVGRDGEQSRQTREPGGIRGDYLRRPQSVSATSLPSAGGGTPSLRVLHQTLLRHAGEASQARVTTLPHEPQVLSTLLCPFTGATRYPYMRVEEEQVTAVESFELVANSWAAGAEAATVARAMWCTRAAASLSPGGTRTRILGILWRLVAPGERGRILLTPHGFHSLASGLLLLLAALYRTSGVPASATPVPYPQSPSFTTSAGYSLKPANFTQPPHPDIDLVQELIPQFRDASLGEVEDDRIEDVYATELSVTDRRHPDHVRAALFAEALVATIENAPGTGEWLLCFALEKYWPQYAPNTWSTLQAIIAARRIHSFCRASGSLLVPLGAPPPSPLQSPSQFTRLPSSSSADSSADFFGAGPAGAALPSAIVAVLESRVIPEAAALDRGAELDAVLISETRKAVAGTVLALLCVGSTSGVTDVFGSDAGQGLQGAVSWARSRVCAWYDADKSSPWKVALEAALLQVITDGWEKCTCILSALLTHLPQKTAATLFSTLVPPLNDQLIERPPLHPSPQVSDFLTTVARTLPLVFFKPLFACAASDRDTVVALHLCTMLTHARHVADYWVRDAEMICVALLGGARGSAPHGAARIGQLVLLVELVGAVRILRRRKEVTPAGTNGEVGWGDVVRFAAALETRVWAMIEVQERAAPLAPALRMLLCMLFRELRLLTRSLKPASWLARTLQWFHTHVEDEYIGDLEQDVERAVARIQDLYLIAQAGVQERHKRHTTMLAVTTHKSMPTGSTDGASQLDLAAEFAQHRTIIESLAKGYMGKALKLFVTMSGLVTAEDALALAPLLWEHCLLGNADASLTASACFMLMQCTEKSPMDVRTMIELDMQSSDDTSRLEAVRKIGVLTNWRFQITTQNFIADRSHRPFKLARPPLPFIATDIGSPLYVPSADPQETRDPDEVPLELRRRLAELGWTDEEGVIIDPRNELIKTPFSILPVAQWDRQEVGTTDIVGSPTSPLGTPQQARNLRAQREQAQQTAEDVQGLLRRSSSAGGVASGVRRRAVFVPPLTLVFPRLCTLTADPDFAVAAAARTTLLDLMRNDPALITRPALDLLAGEGHDVPRAVTALAALLHVRRALPPPAAHNIFNNLAGLLKLLARAEAQPDALADFGLIMPVLARLAPQVSALSMREIRRAKIDHFIVPTGALWFAPTAPKGAMFPRGLDDVENVNPFGAPAARLVSITFVRVAQNMFFLAMLKRNALDVQVVRKNMITLALPTLDVGEPPRMLELADFTPQHTRSDARNEEVDVLSLMVARSAVLLIAQIFRAMPRHLSDRAELAVLVDGLNRALVLHGDDINIVSHVLIALMVASTRFRRLFTSGSGYTLFMPALVKVYTETTMHQGIRNAIEYAINRFYALHKDIFLYQMINVAGQMTMLPNIDATWFSKGVFDLLVSLRRGVQVNAADIAGIYNANRAEEREALMLHTADEKPQTFLASIKRVESDTGRHMSFALPEEYENNRLDMPDLVRLFWTVIAHDLSIARAEHFLRLLLFLTPHLYNAASRAQTLLAEGITALGQILNKAFAKVKHNENTPKPAASAENATFVGPSPETAERSKERDRTPSDPRTLRIDYLRLIIAYNSAGGKMSPDITRHAFDVVKSLVKDSGEADLEVLSRFLSDFVKTLLPREGHASAKAVVALMRELSSLLQMHISLLDFTGVLETVLKLSEMPLYASDSTFCQVVVEQICAVGLAACNEAASKNQALTLRYRPVLIRLVAESIFFKGTDIIAILENGAPTYQYLSAVILPLTLSMKTEAKVLSNGLMNEDHRFTLAAAWVRILSYAMTACQNSRRDVDGTRQLGRLAGSFTRAKSGKERPDAFYRSHLPTLMTALQVLKVIVIRGAADISSLPRLGIWERLAEFFRSMLAEGSADFALKNESNSAASTPTGSPRNSSQFDMSASSSTLFVSSLDPSRPGSPFSHSERVPAHRRPRIIDYSLWSVLEFACAYRSPLRMQLKVLTMEKVVALDQALLQQQWGRGGASPMLASPSSRRLSTSLFSKSRQRASGLGPSPDSSPRIMPMSSSLMPSPSLLDIPGRLEVPARRPGYQISPVTPQPPRAGGLPKIVHLGPVSPLTPSPGASPLIGGGARVRMGSGDTEGGASTATAKATRIRSLKLVQETYRRVRGVQAYMGYELLLPLPGAGAAKDGDEDAGLQTWTRAQALSAIVLETRDLLEEFEESFGMDEESVFVDVDTDTTIPFEVSSPI